MDSGCSRVSPDALTLASSSAGLPGGAGLPLFSGAGSSALRFESPDFLSETHSETHLEVDSDLHSEIYSEIHSELNSELNSEIRSDTPPEPCVFCGTPLTCEDKRKRCKTKSKLGEFVGRFCRPTEVVYPHLARLKGEDRLPLCIPCVNWQRRCGQGQRKRCGGEKPYLLADHFVIFMLEPGRVTVPDQRCTLRLINALANEECAKPLLGLMPVQVQAMVGVIAGRISPAVGGMAIQDPQGPRVPRQRILTTENLLNELVRAWWEYNGRTVFFAHNVTAKLVRKMIKEA